jgi:hypothetical protein
VDAASAAVALPLARAQEGSAMIVPEIEATANGCARDPGAGECPSALHAIRGKK